MNTSLYIHKILLLVRDFLEWYQKDFTQNEQYLNSMKIITKKMI